MSEIDIPNNNPDLCATCHGKNDGGYYDKVFGYICEGCHKNHIKAIKEEPEEHACKICGRTYKNEDLKYIFEYGYVCGDWSCLLKICL